MNIELKREEDLEGKVTFTYFESGFPKKIFEGSQEEEAKGYFAYCRLRLEAGFPKTEIILTADI